MKPWKTLATAPAPGGATLTLRQRGDEVTISVDGNLLMSSRTSASERAMAEAGCARLGTASAPRILIGGLGLGYTLRAALELLPSSASVVVAELSEAVVTWCRGPLASLTGSALDDPRVELRIKDVRKVLGEGPFDAILLDVDNGPTALTRGSNTSLYDQAGIASLHGALRKKGTLVVWSAGPDAAFLERLNRIGFDAVAREVKAQGTRHVLFVACPS